MQTSYPLLESFTDTLSLKQLAENEALVKEVQALLKQGGFLNANADGLFDTKTVTAFQQFKIAAYLEYPNLLGRTTAEALLEISDQYVRKPPDEADKLPPETSKGRSFQLFDNSRVYTDDMLPGSEHFTWGEATKNGWRVPRTKEIMQRIISAAVYMDRVRAFLGNRPIVITSWYRPPDVNRSIGGAENSMHIQGFGIDFKVQGIPPLQVSQRLHSWHGSRGGIGRSGAFTHLDLRGYYARWSYGS